MDTDDVSSSVNNRSGGADLNAQGDFTIQGDVVGRDKLVSNTHNYFTGDFATLDDLYIHPDAVFQRVQIQDFVGREWLTAKVNAFLNDPQRKSGALLLVGEAGVGKTAFLAHLVSTRRYLHLFAEQVPGEANLARALQSLGAQLVARYALDPYKDRNTLPAIAAYPDFLERLLRLAANKLSPGEKIVIVCDALDEAGIAPNGNVFGLPSVLPDGVYLILSQRPIPTRLNIKGGLLTEKIEAAGANNLSDIEKYLTAVACRSEVSGRLHAYGYSAIDFVRTLTEKSGGVWMYLYYVISEIVFGNRAPLDLARLPSGLAGYYAEYWGDWAEGRNGRGEGPAQWDAFYAPLLATLAAAQLPISLTQLLTWSQVPATPYEIERLLRRNWRAFVTESDSHHTPHFRLYHASLRDFFTARIDRQGLTPEADQLIDGLMRRVRQAHARIVACYRRQCGGDWARLVDDDYARTYLCLHLSASGADETLYHLTTMSNAWAEARYAHKESYPGYLVDLNRAWQYAETGDQGNLGRQIRCALVESSIHSLAGSIPADLLALLVQTSVWSPARALSHISLIPYQSRRADSLSYLAALLPDELKVDALAAACDITNEFHRIRAFAGLSPYWPDTLKANILSAVQAITDGFYCVQALADLIPHLPDTLKADAIRNAWKVACAMTDEHGRAGALAFLLPHLPDTLKANAACYALKAIRAFTDDDRVKIIYRLAPHLPSDLKADALAAARAIASDVPRAHALSNLAAHLPDDLQASALAVACDIADASARAHALSGLAPYLPVGLQADALVATRTLYAEDRVRVLSDFVPHLSEDLKADVVYKALDIARALANEAQRVYALLRLAPHLPDDLKAVAMSEALAAARVITEERYRALALSSLVPHLPDDLQAAAVRESLAAMRAMGNIGDRLIIEDDHIAALSRFVEDDRVVVLSRLMPHLPDDLKVSAVRSALAAARAIADEVHRVNACFDLVPYLPDDLKAAAMREALAETCAIADESYRALALSEITPHLPDDLKADALAAARAITDEKYRARALSDIIPHLSDDLKAAAMREALAATCAITDESDRARALSDIARDLPDDLKAVALAIARAITDERHRAHALFNIARYLADELKADAMREALAATCAIADEFYRADALSSLAPYLPDDLKAAALVAARAITDEESRFRALSDFAPHLPENLKAVAVYDALPAALGITDKSKRADALSRIIPYLSASLKDAAVRVALDAARSITDEFQRALALSSLALRLPDNLQVTAVSEALAVACTIDYWGTEVFRDLVPHLPDRLKADALAAASAITDEESRFRVLSDFVPHLSDDLKADALAAALSFTDETYSVLILSDLTPHLSDDLKADALAAVRAFTGDFARALALSRLTPHLPDDLKADTVRDALAAARAITHKGNRALALSELAPLLAEDLKLAAVKEAFAFNQTVSNHSVRRYTYTKVIATWHELHFADFPVQLWQDALHTLARNPRRELLYNLTDFLPLIEHLGGAAAICEFFFALRDVSQWWP